MSIPELNIDTSRYDDLPLSVFIYEPLFDGDGRLQDYRVVYANNLYAADWRRIYHNDDYIGARLIENTLMDEHSFAMMERFLTEPPHAFTSYMPLVNLHLHFEPMQNLAPPYYGFFITNITDIEDQDAKIHFLKNIRQMKNNAVLIRVHEDNHMECVYVSDDFAKMMECSVEEAVDMMDGAGSVMSTHPEDRPLVRSMLKRRVSDDGSTDLIIQKMTAKGNVLWCNVHYAFIDDFGEHYIYCTYYNVTVLKEYEERLRSVYISLGNNFYRVGEKTLAQFRVDLTRDNVEDIRGRDLLESDSADRPYSELIHMRAANLPIASEREAFLRAFDPKNLMNGYLEGRTTVSHVLYSRRRDGVMRYVRITATLTRHPMTGDVIAFVTEEECNDEKVRDTLLGKIMVQQFDMVSYISDGSYGVVIGDGTRIARGSIFPISRTGKYSQYLDGQVIPVLSGTPAEKARMAEALSIEEIEKQLKIHEPYVVNIACDIDDDTFYKRFDFYSIDPESRFYIVLKSDTTDIQKEQIARNEQLKDALQVAEQANVAKTAFLSSMSHEIRTPMNAIIGLDNIALKDPELPQRTREHLEKIGGSARHLLGLINDILDMSRIESGRMVLKNEEFSFSGMLEQINTMINGQCQDKHLDFECQIKGSVDDYYIGDDMKLKQVLINILGNAVKFTPSPGTVSFIIERTAQFEDKSTLRFVIQDTGIGMDKEYIPKIFEAFTQEDATSTNKYGGSGLGMAITKNIVEMMNGSITVDSEKGVGSTFTVNVTLKNSDRTEAQTSTVRPQDLNVLIIDDDPLACEHAKLVLEEIGVAADTCLSGKEAIEIIRLSNARRESYNLILVDLKMPEQDGVEVTREIRKIIGNESAIIILTAYNWDDVEDEAVKAGVDSFMAKPLFASGVLLEFQQAITRKNIIHPEEEIEIDLTGRRVLLAEDMLINAEIMMELLDMQDVKAEHAENGKIAVEMFSASAAGYYDAILMDVRMPEMDGLEATAAIRALDRPDAKTVPIIAMTANAFDEDVQRSLQAGMNAHLSKPVEPERLYETLATFIAKRP